MNKNFYTHVISKNDDNSNEISDREKEQIINRQYIIDNIEEATKSRVGGKSIEKYEEYIEECILYKVKEQRCNELESKKGRFAEALETYVQNNEHLDEDILINLMTNFIKSLLGEDENKPSESVEYLMSILDMKISNPIMKQVDEKIEEAIRRERVRSQMTDHLIMSLKDKMDNLYDKLAYRSAINPYEVMEDKEKLQQMTDVYFNKVSESKINYNVSSIKDISDIDYRVVCNLKNLDIDINLSELAKKVGVTRSFISNIVNNRTNTSLLIGMKIARVLNLKVEDIFELEESDILI